MKESNSAGYAGKKILKKLSSPLRLSNASFPASVSRCSWTKISGTWRYGSNRTRIPTNHRSCQKPLKLQAWKWAPNNVNRNSLCRNHKITLSLAFRASLEATIPLHKPIAPPSKIGSQVSSINSTEQPWPQKASIHRKLTCKGRALSSWRTLFVSWTSNQAHSLGTETSTWSSVDWPMATVWTSTAS